MIGPGKYDSVVTEIRTRLHADGVILVVIGGHLGAGFSAQLPAALMPVYADMLDAVVKQIRADYESAEPGGGAPS